ncbi:MAG: type II secretion system ATPase GspE [Thermodesulfovibrionales bacterium]|nr:type II secretion system ATPase GspE [Thermodesulfovibrionales bacterium]
MIKKGDLQVKHIGQMLIDSGLINKSQLEIALKEQQNTRRRVGETLVSLGFISTDALLDTLSLQLGFKYLKFQEFPKAIPPDSYPSVKFMKQYRVVPIGKDNGVLKVAMADPLDSYALAALRLYFKGDIEIVLSNEKDIEEAIEQYFGNSVQMTSIMEGMSEEAESLDTDIKDDVHHLRDMALEAPIVKLVNMLITKAIEERASDIHIEAFENKIMVRYRIDGILIVAESLPKKLQSAVISRIKIMSKMNIAERRLPQDGRIKLRISGREIDLRVSTLPTLYGESVVMRILDRGNVLTSLEELGFPEAALSQFKKLIAVPYGMILATGPTGSGKTTTLYGALSKLNSFDRKIITIEDPIEYEIDGINQMQVKPKIGLTFANGLRHIVRQDPDIIMVGEIRDKETAEIAIHSALTGHLVFSTLHTNDAPGAITRLLDMGIESFLVSSALTGVLAQRLVRVICPKCKRLLSSDKGRLKEIGANEINFEAYFGEGCDDCRHTGYKSRTGIFELMVLNDDIKRLVLEKASADVIRQKARSQGMGVLRECGWQKVKSGITTIDEVLRVTQEETNENLLL